MRRSTPTLALMVWLALPAPGKAQSALQQPAQGGPPSSASVPAAPAPQDPTAAPVVVDSIVARIEDDIITESEVRELESFQKLVDGKAKSRKEILSELVDQWVIRNEATAARFGHLPVGAVDHELERLRGQFSSTETFHSRLSEVGLTESALRRILEEQLYLTHFLDFKFRPAAQVDPKQIEAYYGNEFTSELKSRGQAVPPLSDVEDQIRELLTQRAINDRAALWLADARSHLRIDLTTEEERP